MPHAWYSASFATGTEQAENTGTHGLKTKNPAGQKAALRD